MRLDGRRLEWMVAVGVALLAVLVYANSLANGFAYDDVWIIETRDLVHGLGNLPDLLTAEYWPGRFQSGLYRPVTLVSFALDWEIWSGRPFGFHLTNLILHALVSAVLALLLLRWFPWWAAAAGGAVFAVHPVHTEAVANVVGRAELLAVLFVGLACLRYVSATRREGLSPATIGLIAALYALAILSKEVGVILPGLLLLTDLPAVVAGRASSWREYVRSRVSLMTVLALVLLACLVLRGFVLGAALQSVPDRAFTPDASFPTRLFTMARVWPRYFELMLFPTELSADYSPAVILPVTGLTGLGALGFLLVGGTLVLMISVFRRAPELTLAVGWAALALLPVSNLLFVAEIVLAERTFYLPSFAVSVVAALALARARARAWVGAALALWVAGFSLVTVRRNPVWASTETVFEDLAEHHPESSRLLWWLGDQQAREGNWEAARELYRQSLRIWPYHAQYLAEFAVRLNQHDELVEAERVAAGAVGLAPDYPDHHSLLAVIRLRRGDASGALAATSHGIARVGQHPVLYSLQADALAALGDPARAAAAQDTFLQLRAGAARWQDWFELAELRAAAGDTAGARGALYSALRAPGVDLGLADSLAQVLGELR